MISRKQKVDFLWKLSCHSKTSRANRIINSRSPDNSIKINKEALSLCFSQVYRSADVSFSPVAPHLSPVSSSLIPSLLLTYPQSPPHLSPVCSSLIPSLLLTYPQSAPHLSPVRGSADFPSLRLRFKEKFLTWWIGHWPSWDSSSDPGNIFGKYWPECCE